MFKAVAGSVAKTRARRIGIRGKMLGAIGLILACGLVATVVAFIGYARVDAMIAVVTGRSIPAMNEAQMLSLQAERLVSLAPRLAAVDDVAGKGELAKSIQAASDEYQKQLDKIGTNGWAGDRFDDLKKTSLALLANLKEIDEAVDRRLALAAKRADQEKAVSLAEKMIRQGVATLKSDLKNKMEDQLNVMRGSTDSDELNNAAQEVVKINEASGRADSISEAATEARTWIMTGVTSNAEQQITISRSRSGLQLSSIDNDSTYLPDLADVIKDPVSKLRAAAMGNDGLLAIHKEELQLFARSRDLITSNGNLSHELSQAVDGLVHQQEEGIGQVSKETSRLLDSSRMMQIIAAVAGIVISGAVGLLYVGKRVVTRLIALNRAMEEIVRGNVAAEIRFTGSDEITDMGRSLVVFRDTSREVESTRKQSEAERQQAAAERRKAILEIADGFETTVKGVVKSVSEAAAQMQSIAEHMTMTAGDTSREAGSAANAAETASCNVGSAASAAQQLKASIAEIAKRAAEAAAIAGRASGDAQRADDTVRSLDETVGKIDNVLELITSIAGQTNLLALNATIEAARAGDAGKGFAVVASEVKHLASQTAGATEQIEVQIASVHKVTSEAVSAIRSIANTVMTIDEIAAAIAAAVEEQDGATAEIARHVTEAADGTTAASANIGKVRDAAETTGRSAEDVLKAAGTMTAEAERLLHQVDHFLTQVRNG